jgi:hypothetical protein
MPPLLDEKRSGRGRRQTSKEARSKAFKKVEK